MPFHAGPRPFPDAIIEMMKPTPFWTAVLVFTLITLLGLSPRPRAVDEALGAARESRALGLAADAAQKLRAVQQQQPWRSDLWEQIGLLELDAGRLDEARVALIQAQTVGVISPQGELALSRVYRRSGELLEASGLLECMAGKGHLPAQALTELADLRRSQHDTAGETDGLRRLLAVDPSDGVAALRLGKLLLLSDLDEAARLLDQAAAQQPASRAAVDALKLAASRAALEKDPAYRLVEVGRALAAGGDWDLAGQAFDEAVQQNPQYAEAWAFVGEARQHNGGDALAALKEAVRLNPQGTLPRSLLALYYRRNGQADQALPLLEALAVEQPDQGVWQMELGAALAQTGRLEDALTHYQRAARVEPQNAQFWQVLAWFCLDHEMDIRATGLPAARQAVLLAPHDPAALDLMGWTFYYLEDWASAERFLQQAMAADAKYPAAYLHLGQVYIQQNRLGDALPALQQALQLSDGDSAVGQLASRLISQYYGSK